MLWNSAGSLTYLACQWLVTVLVVRLADSYEAAGVLSLAMSVYNMFSPLAIYRMYTYQVSDVKRENSTGEYLAFRFLTCIASLACAVVYGAITCPPAALTAIGLYVAFRFSSLVIDVLHGTDQIHGRMDYMGRSLMLQGIATLAAFALVFGLSGSLEAAFLAMLVATLAVGLVYDLPRTRQFGRIELGISRQKALHLLALCLPIALASVANSAVPSIPRQILAFASGEAMLGIYASVAAPVTIIQMGASYLYNPLLTTFAREYVEGRTHDLAKTFFQVIAGIVAIGLVGTIAFELAGPFALTLVFGEGIASYSYLLTPIIACVVITAFVWFMNDLLVAIRCFSGSVVGNAVALVVSLVGSAPLISAFGMNGVSFSGIAAFALEALVMAAFLMRACKRSPRRQHRS